MEGPAEAVEKQKKREAMPLLDTTKASLFDLIVDITFLQTIIFRKQKKKKAKTKWKCSIYYKHYKYPGTINSAMR